MGNTIKYVLYDEKQNSFTVRYEGKTRVIENGTQTPKTVKDFMVKNANTCKNNTRNDGTKFLSWGNL